MKKNSAAIMASALCGGIALTFTLVASLPATAAAQPTEPTPPAPESPATESPATESPAPESPVTDGATGRESTPPRAPGPTADTAFDQAPPPDQASGIVRQESRAGEGLLWIPRVIFFVPKWTLIIAAQPFRGLAFAYERYNLRERFRQVFFNEDGTIGVYPVAFFETGFGLNVGLRIVHRDLFGAEEGLKLRASYGGRFRQIYSAKLDSGNRLGDRAGLELEVNYEIRPKDRFYGVGNKDSAEPEEVALPLDAIDDTFTVSSRFRQRVARVLLGIDVDIARWSDSKIAATVSGAYMNRKFGGRDELGDDGDYIEDRYLENSLVGFEQGLSNLYGEFELRYDSRRRTSIYNSSAVPATGWLVSGFAGYTQGFGDDPSGYIRYGADIQRYLNLYMGTRIIMLRAFVEAVTGDLDEVPFVDLPPLGGALLLRGYEQDRFRDRALTLGSIEYLYDLGPLFSGVFFVDAGRVWRSLSDFEFDDFRVGFGGGIQMYTRKSFLMRFHLASSTDGGLFVNLSFDPVYNVRDRAGRY